MRIENTPGEFYFKALIGMAGGGYILSQEYFKNKEEAVNRFKLTRDLYPQIIWPAETDESGFVMVPDESEICKKV